MTYKNAYNKETTKFGLTIRGNEIIGGANNGKFDAFTAFLFSTSVSDILIEDNSVQGFPRISNIRSNPSKNISVNLP